MNSLTLYWRNHFLQLQAFYFIVFAGRDQWRPTRAWLKIKETIFRGWTGKVQKGKNFCSSLRILSERCFDRTYAWHNSISFFLFLSLLGQKGRNMCVCVSEHQFTNLVTSYRGFETKGGQWFREGWISWRKWLKLNKTASRLGISVCHSPYQ